VSRKEPGLVDRLVDEYGRTGRWSALGTELDKLDRKRLPPPEQETWFHARGIVEYRTNQRRRAREIFEEGVRQFPESSWLNFGLGQEYEFQGRIDDMAGHFQRVRLQAVGGATVLVVARYFYLWGRFALGQQAIQPIFDRYYELKIADDMFLYMRGLPMFDGAFGYRATFAYLEGRLDVARAELARAQSELTDVFIDRQRINLDATATGDWEPVLADLDALLETLDPKFPAGQLTMKRAMLRSRVTPSVDAALAELESVRLTASDHPWLEDIRTLARAQAFHRFGRLDAEDTALSQFIERQPMLFEPNHAFNFGVIGYQEALRPRYQAGRRPKAEDGE
jgi:tetratricopeptide (TPR) repeat protein